MRFLNFWPSLLPWSNQAGRGWLCLALLAGVTAQAADLEADAEYQLANQALADGLPRVAALKAQRLLAGKGWDKAERQALAGLAVESFIRARDSAAALKILARETVPGQTFWDAQAHLLAGDVETAAQKLEARLDAGESTARERLLLAQAWLRLKRESQARDLLDALRRAQDAGVARSARLMLNELDLNMGTPLPAVQDLTELARQRRDLLAELLRARGLMDLGRYEEAEAALRGLLSSTGGGERTHHAASILLAEGMLRQAKTTECVEALVQFLDNTPESQMWAEAFDLLARALTPSTQDAAPAPSTAVSPTPVPAGQVALPTPLPPPDAALRWMVEGNTVQRQVLAPSAPEREVFQGHALLLMARWLLAAQRPQEALGLLEAMLMKHQGHPQGAEAMRLALETYGDQKAEARVAALTAQWRQRYGAGQSAMVDFVSGGTAYSRREYSQAAALFQAAANVAATLAERRAALYNAAVSALRAGESALYLALLSQLQVVSAGTSTPGSAADSAADLELDQALEMAAQGQLSAQQGLHFFIQNHPNHPRLPEAALAQAEVLLLQLPTDFPAVEAALRTFDALSTSTEKQQQQADLVRLWLLDKQGHLKEMTDAGQEFIKRWPQSPQTASVRMKIADGSYRLENFAAARTEYELVAQEYAGSPFADTALYFAGMAAISMMSDEGRETAISHWQELAERGGPLSLPARQQQALAKRRAGQDAEALMLLDSLLTEKNLSPDMRRSLACERAEILMLLGKSDPRQLEKAIQSLRTLLREDGLTYFWRSRAGYTLAAVLHTAGLVSEALEACYDVVQASGYSGPANPAEFRWFYRAGFFGIELLENAKDWEAAARLAEKLALSTGERASEARELATRIRLERFLWDAK